MDKNLITEKNLIICDIDGTIADLTHRLPYINPPEGQRKDWKAFHAGVSDDAPHVDMLEILRALLRDWEGWKRQVIYVSGRNEASREATKQWMHTHGFPYGRLYMRADGDYRDDAVVKEEIIDGLNITPAIVLCVLDDRDRVVEMWRRRGFRCLQVASGNF